MFAHTICAVDWSLPVPFSWRGGEPLGSSERGSSVLGLPPSIPTLASRLRDAGYRTALTGKWHLGYAPTFGPRTSGYEYFYGATSGAIDYFTHKDSRGVHDLWENETGVNEDGYFTDLVTDRAVNWISKQSSAQPFLLSVHYAAHQSQRWRVAGHLLAHDASHG